jgi:hypothetical protein
VRCSWHSIQPRRKPILIAAALSLLLLGIGIAMSFG